MSSPGLRKSLRILTEIGRSDGPISFSTLKEKTGTTNATLTRLLGVLIEERWVIKAPQGGYTCGHELHSVAESVSRKHGVSEHIRRAVEHSAEATGESACFITWEDTYFVIRHKVDMPESFHYMPVGKPNTHPLVNGLGKLLLAHQTESIIEDVAKLNGLSQAKTTECFLELIELKKQGFCVSDDYAFRIGVPVFHKGNVIGVLGISTARRGISEAIQGEWRDALLKGVQEKE